jgi:hypothetical protein
VAFRFPDGLVTRLDAYAAKMEAEMLGLRFSRADAARVLLEKGLAEAGFPAKQEKKAKRR